MNKQEITISILFSETTASRYLIEQIKKLISNLPNNKLFSIINVVVNGSQYDMLKATIESDLVIFDASVEWDENKGYDSNYFAATANPISDDRILVVSRTKLPINFVPMRTNVPMLGEEIKVRDKKGIIRSKNTYTNEEIIDWLLSTINEMIQEGRIPKKADMKIKVPPFEQLSTISSELPVLIERNSMDSLDYMQSKSKSKRGAFISYRSRYCHEKINGWDVYELEKYIKKNHNSEKYPVLYYPDGDISKEFMTEQRRWEIVSFVDRRLREVEEVWIFNSYSITENSNVSNYLDSWWTQGEILALMYIKAGSPKDFPKRIYLFDPYTGNIEEKGSDFIPEMNDQLHQEIARYYSNSDSLTSGNEGLGNMRMLRNTNGLLRRLAYHEMKKIQKKMYPKGTEMYEVMESITYDSYVESLNSHVYDLSFTENRIATCPTCQQKNTTITHFKDPYFIKNFIKTNSDSLQDKKEIGERGFFSVAETEFEKIVQTGMWRCPRCNKSFTIEYKPENNQYRWWPIRMGKRTGPNDVLIEKIPVYEITNRKE